MPRFKSMHFIKISLKLSYFTKNANFLVLGFRPQTPVPSAAGGFAPSLRRLEVSPPGPKNIPPLRISGYAPDVLIAVMLFCVN